MLPDNFLPWQKSEQELADQLGTSSHSGLTNDEVALRLANHGPNKLDEEKPKTFLQRFFAGFKDLMIMVLLGAAAISLLTGEAADAMVIMAIVILNAILGAVQEGKAEQALAALKELSSPQSKVLRNGQIEVVDSTNLVVGDIVLLDAGDYVPADLRLIETANLKIDEAALTGESLPAGKADEILTQGADLPLGDRLNIAYMGTLVTYGRGRGIVVGTGMGTEMGRIAGMLKDSGDAMTPLQIRLAELGKALIILTVGICALVFVLGLFRHHELLEMFLTAVALAVAVIPEGLPAMVTIVLAIGMQRMVKKNAIIRRLQAVETLGAATVICSDKTGTLTQNRMTIVKAWTADGLVPAREGTIPAKSLLDSLLELGALCNDADMHLNEEGKRVAIGDPTEVAFLDWAAVHQRDHQQLRRDFPRVAEAPFDSARKMMSTVHPVGDIFQVAVKGAPDILLDKCSHLLTVQGEVPLTDALRQQILAANMEMAENALRVLGVAKATQATLPEEVVPEDLEQNLTFVGLVGMIDPPRLEVIPSVELCRQAGIRPVMITGDHQETAFAIAKEIGIATEHREAISGVQLEAMSDEELTKRVYDYTVYARVSPEHKVRIVKAWQANGQVVAMTGDGVNDAPALKRADIGCAMGITGTEVSKGAADMVLADDNFATIVSAVEEGRHIYANIKKGIHFLLSCNIGEIFAILTPLVVGLPNPLLPIQILWINLVTDSLPALALGVDPAEPGTMQKKPRDPKESIFADGTGWRIFYQGVMVGGVSFAAFFIGLEISPNPLVATTMTFMVLSFSQKVHAFNVRTPNHSLFKVGFFTNPHLILAVVISGALQLGVLFVPFFREMFHLTLLSGVEWAVVIALSVAPFFIVELEKVIYRLIKQA